MNILATSAAFRPARREGLMPSPVLEYAIELAEVNGRRPKVCVLHTALGDDSRWIAMTYAPASPGTVRTSRSATWRCSRCRMWPTFASTCSRRT